MGHRDYMKTIEVDDRHVLLVDAETSYRSGPGAKHWWLLRDDAPVAFLKTLTYTDGRQAGYDFVLCDIEVREEYRGQGLTHTLVEAVEKIEGLPIWTSGSRTPLGKQALGWLRVKPWDEVMVNTPDMTFVDDWDGLQSRFRL